MIARADVLRLFRHPTRHELLGMLGQRRMVTLRNGHWNAGIYYVVAPHRVVFQFIKEDPGRRLYMRWKRKGDCISFTVLRNDPFDAAALRGDRTVFEVLPFCLSKPLD